MDIPVRYKTNLSDLRSAGIDAIDQMLMSYMPGTQFGLVIFEEDDFAKQNITYLLFKEIPQRVRVSVTGEQPLHHALFTIASLNAHVRFSLSGKPFTVDNPTYGKEQVQILMVLSTEMEVDRYGILLNGD